MWVWHVGTEAMRQRDTGGFFPSWLNTAMVLSKLTFIMPILTHTNFQFPLIPEGIMANSISSLKAKFCFLTIYGSYATKENMVK